MPLSEHEQRLLEQMERALYAEDSKFVQNFRGSERHRHRRRQLGIAVVGFVVGLALLFVGLAAPSLLIVSVLGFLVMLGAAMYLLRSSRRDTTLEVISGGLDPSPPQQPGRTRRPAKSSRRAGFMAKVEERWRRRADGDGRF